MGTYTPNLNLYKPDSSDDLSDFRTEFNNNMDKLDNGGGGGGGHTIVDENGSDMPAESKLQFTGNVSVTDDNVNGATVVDILGGGGGSGLIVNAQIYSDNEKVVGIWRDNKPLYQKTLFATSGLSSHMVFSHGIPDIDTLAKSECILRADDDSYQIPITTDQANAEFEVTPTDIEIWLNNDFLNLLGNGGYAITLWYTKTTDTAGSGGYEAYGFSPVIYSDTERKIGVWRDNKPLYQKTFIATFNNLANDTATNVADISGLNIDEVADISGRCNYYNGANWFNIDFSTYYAVYAYPNGYLQFKQKMTNVTVDRVYKVAITLRYTKTTDVAGSGDYNTYGVPTVHYDNTEKVIGTYLGKPLYQITYSGLSLVCTNANQSYATNTDWGNIDKVVHSDIIDHYGQSCAGSVIYTGTPAKLGVSMQMANRTVTDITIQYTKTTD